MGANGVYLASLVKSVPITINRSVLKTVFGLKFKETAPTFLTRKMAKDLCLTHYACPQKLAAYKYQNRTPPYHVLFLEPRLFHYVFVHIFYPKDRSKLAYNKWFLNPFIVSRMDTQWIMHQSLSVTFIA